MHKVLGGSFIRWTDELTIPLSRPSANRTRRTPTLVSYPESSLFLHHHHQWLRQHANADPTPKVGQSPSNPILVEPLYFQSTSEPIWSVPDVFVRNHQIFCYQLLFVCLSFIFLLPLTNVCFLFAFSSGELLPVLLYFFCMLIWLFLLWWLIAWHVLRFVHRFHTLRYLSLEFQQWL